VSLDPHSLKLHLYGSRLTDSSSSGFAVLAEYPVEWNRTNEILVDASLCESIDNRLELRACIWALRWIREQVPALKLQRVQIVTDSKYIYENWRRAEYWRANSWCDTEGGPIESGDLWKEVLSFRAKLRTRIDLKWVTERDNTHPRNI
jgi:ribonuclease HI